MTHPEPRRSIAGRCGFTLVELLVVVAIVAVLLGITVPAVSRARVAAQRTACAAKLHGVGVGLTTYINQTNGFLPYAAVLPSLGTSSHPGIAETLDKELDSDKALLCPSDQHPQGGRYFDSEQSSYAFNTMLNGQKVDENFLSDRFGPTNVFIMYDYRPFHGQAGEPGSTNYLFADGHVGDLKD